MGFLLSVIGIAIIAITKPEKQEVGARTASNSATEPGPAAAYRQALQHHDE